jgi:hypothetical protein
MTSKAVFYDRGSPTIVVVNKSDWLPARDLERVVAAAQKQVDRDFFPLWGWRAKLEIRNEQPERGAMCIIMLNEPGKDDEGAEGYHFSDEGLPTTYIFTRDEKGKRVENYAPTMSHEVLEMIADPGVNLYADGYYITKTGRHMSAFIPYEVCDPVQENTYEINGRTMSDFVVPEWFEYEHKRNSMRFSFLDAVAEPFELAPGGYTDAVVGRTIRTQWGEEANRERRRHRQKARLKKTKRFRH